MTSDASCEYKKILALVEAGALKDANGPVKMCVFKLTKRFTDENFFHEFLQLGGTELLLRISLEGKANTASYAMTGLLKCMCNLHALEYVSNHSESFQRLYQLIYSDDGTVARNAVALLAVITEFAQDGYFLVQQAARKSVEARQLHPYNRLLILLKEKDIGTQLNAFLFLNTILRKSVSVGAAEEINGQLSELELLSMLQEMEKGVLDSRVREQINILIPILSNYHTSSETPSESRVSHHLNHQEWASDALSNYFDRCMSGSGLTRRVIALDGTSALAGEKKTEDDMVAILKAHLDRLEKNLDEMKHEKEEEKVKRDAEVKAQLEKQKLMEREMASHQEKSNEIINRLITEIQEKEKIRQTEKTQEAQKKEEKYPIPEAVIAAMEKQIKELQTNQEALMRDYEEMQIISAQQQYLQAHSTLWTVYQIVQCKLNELFLAYKTLNSGLVMDKDMGQSMIAKAIQLAGEQIPIPFAKAATGVISGTINHFHQKKQKKQANTTSNLAVTVSAFEKLSEHVAREIAFRYEEQIRCLSQNGAKMLGECGVRRMFEAMQNGMIVYTAIPDSHGHKRSPSTAKKSKTLVEQLVDGCALVEIKQGVLKLKNKPIEALNKDVEWTESGIFKKSGIRTLDGHYFSGPDYKPERYGYRLGDEELAKSLGLKKHHSRITSWIPERDVIDPVKKMLRQRSLPSLLPSKTPHPSSTTTSSTSPTPIPTTPTTPTTPLSPISPISPSPASSFSTSSPYSSTPSPLDPPRKLFSPDSSSPLVSPSQQPQQPQQQRQQQQHQITYLRSDQIVVDRALISAYDQRLANLETRVKEIDGLKSQVAQLHALVATLVKNMNTPHPDFS